MSTTLISYEELKQKVDSLPRKHLAVLPTGLQALPRLAAAARIGELLVKRDDLTGIALGGNKSRLMEFILGDAIAKGCDVFIAGGGGEQSNHAVQCVAAANRVGLETIIVLQRRPDARTNGNALLHEVVGGKTLWIDSDPLLQDRTSAGKSMQTEAERLMALGRHPYVLESSLHALSVVAYVNATIELFGQLTDPQTKPTRIYVTSEGAVLGGLLLGSQLLGLPWELIGLDWRPTQSDTRDRLHGVISAAATVLGVANPVEIDDIEIHPAGGPAYGVGRPESWTAISTAARLEGLLLDPVYTAKGYAGMIEDLKYRPPSPDERIIFIHTGGIAALFAYEAELRRNVIAPPVSQ